MIPIGCLREPCLPLPAFKSKSHRKPTTGEQVKIRKCPGCARTGALPDGSGLRREPQTSRRALGMSSRAQAPASARVFTCAGDCSASED
jgi:hypothetical protein